ncbi:glycoside hydrolase family 54 protein [Mycena amicta]|nr:glycoside hydrolase family 54 protein [Mycena amicta]
MRVKVERKLICPSGHYRVVIIMGGGSGLGNGGSDTVDSPDHDFECIRRVNFAFLAPPARSAAPTPNPSTKSNAPPTAKQPISRLSRLAGVANAAAQDSFCQSTTCVITTIYDQSGRGNHLTKAPPGTANSGTDPGGFDNLAAADGAPVTLNGHKAYSVFIPPGTGYRNDATNAIATVTVQRACTGLHHVRDVNFTKVAIKLTMMACNLTKAHARTHSRACILPLPACHCCFDYGNAETKNNDLGNGHMEAIYFGTGGPGGAGSGPWLGTDLENGLFSGGTRNKNNNSASLSSRFVTTVLKGKPGAWALRGGNTTSGGLKMFFGGARPAGGYNPMKLEGAMVLGVGGDNSNRGLGTFYEGVMTSGFPSDTTENAVQANIVAAKYATTAIVSGPVVAVGSHISLHATTACRTIANHFISHTAGTVNTQVVTSSSSAALRQAASWTVVKGLANGQCISLQSRDADPSLAANSFIRFSAGKLLVNANDGSKDFKEDATFCPRIPLNGKGHSYRSWNHPTRYLAVMYAARNGGANSFDAAKSFNDDVSFSIEKAFA